MSVAIVGSGLAGFTAYQTLRRELGPEQIAVFGTEDAPASSFARRGGAVRARGPAACDALGERRALPAGLVPRARARKRLEPAIAGAARADGDRPLPPD